jgi:hypothetical protein
MFAGGAYQYNVQEDGFSSSSRPENNKFKQRRNGGDNDNDKGDDEKDESSWSAKERKNAKAAFAEEELALKESSFLDELFASRDDDNGGGGSAGGDDFDVFGENSSSGGSSSQIGNTEAGEAVADGVGSDSGATPKAVEKMTVAELKAMCRESGLKVWRGKGGRKGVGCAFCEWKGSLSLPSSLLLDLHYCPLNEASSLGVLSSFIRRLIAGGRHQGGSSSADSGSSHH